MTVWRIAAVRPTNLQPDWAWTPYRSQQPDHWLHGLGCSQANATLKAAIVDAMNSPGSVYKVGGEQGQIVIPEQGYLVEVFNRRAVH